MNEHARIPTPDGIELDFPLAGFASRALAGMLDLLLLLFFWTLLLLTTIGFSGLTAREELGALGMALAVMVAFLSYWGYGIFFEQVLRGQTPGKKALGLRAIRENGLPLGLKQSLLRNLLRVVDLQPGTTYVVAMASMVSDPLGRRLGDVVAGTLVVRDHLAEARATRSGALWAARAEEGQGQQALRLAGGSLSPLQLSTLEQFQERRASLHPARRAEVAARIGGSFRAALSAEQLKLLERDPEALLEEIQTLAQQAAQETSVGSERQTRAESLF